VTAAAPSNPGAETTDIVANDHSAEPASGLPAVSGGVPVRRQIAGAAVVVFGLPALTAVLVEDRDALPLATPALLVLVVVVLAAVLGGVRVGLPAAVLGGLILNWFFTVPYGSLVVHRLDQLVVLGVYLIVAAAVSVVVGISARRTAEATRAKAEAQALSSLAGAALAEVETLPGLLEQIRTVFGVREVALLEYDHGIWSEVEAVADTAAHVGRGGTQARGGSPARAGRTRPGPFRRGPAGPSLFRAGGRNRPPGPAPGRPS
jgi:K+-sensing histidine kinase KdpD